MRHKSRVLIREGGHIIGHIRSRIIYVFANDDSKGTLSDGRWVSREGDRWFYDADPGMQELLRDQHRIQKEGR